MAGHVPGHLLAERGQPAVAGPGTPASAAPSAALPPADRDALAAELALLPGLNGPWWCEETPWLTPYLREAIGEKVLSSADPAALLGDRTREYLESNTDDVQNWLWDAAGRCRGDLSPRELELLDRLKSFADGNHDDDQQTARALEELLQPFVAGGHHAGHHVPMVVVGEGPVRAADLHTEAVLEHRIAVLDRDKARAEEAKKTYDKALEAYAAEKKTLASPRLLCLVDSALLCAEMLNDPKEAKQRLDEALAAGSLPLLFHVSTLTQRGEIAAASAAKSSEYEDHLFTHAKRLLADSDAVRSSLPLAAYVSERYAWSLMDQWEVEEANKQFQAAYHVRLADKEEKNPLAAVYVLHDRHGMAMTARYRGHLDGARRTYKSIVDEIKAALAEAERRHGGAGQEMAVRSLRERLSNSLERWADCELYSGAASDGKVNLLQAAESYDQARGIAPEWSDALVIGCKLAIVLRPGRQEPGGAGGARRPGRRQTAGTRGEPGAGDARQASGRCRGRRDGAAARRGAQTPPPFPRPVQAQSGLSRQQPPRNHGAAAVRRRAAAPHGPGRRIEAAAAGPEAGPSARPAPRGPGRRMEAGGPGPEIPGPRSWRSSRAGGRCFPSFAATTNWQFAPATRTTWSRLRTT